MNPTEATAQKGAMMIQLLYTINRLTQKAFAAPNQKSLTFTILNDTIQLVHYDRATLWNIEGKKPILLGVSGQAKVEKKSALAKQWTEQLSHLEEITKPSTITLKTENEEQVTQAVWLPILSEDRPLLGLWLENWHTERKGPDLGC